MLISKLIWFKAIIIFTCFSVNIASEEIPKLPIGMNMNANNYYASPIFRDLMKSASEWITCNASGDGPWDTKKLSEIPLDDQGYPLELPVKVSGGLPPQGVRFLINRNYKGEYLLKYDGDGELEIRFPHSKRNGKTILSLDGKGTNLVINIKKSNKGNHIRNIRILPVDTAEDTSTLFEPLFLEGLKPFHCLRFWGWMQVENPLDKTWESRSKPDYYSQGLTKGIAIEYMIQLCNLLKCDAWFCIPYQVDDDYMHRFAELVRDELDPQLKIYLEYSNELWNWIFPQSHYVLENAPGALDIYVSEALKKISPESKNHPEKDAYMMQRTFKIWSDVFNGNDRQRLIRVATVQHSWADNTRRILQYLFKHDENGKPVTDKIYQTSTGAGCDAVSPGGYFSYTDKDHERWVAMDPKLVTSDMILDAVEKDFASTTENWTLKTAKFANAWKVENIVYEGGQHIQPYQQKEWAYNHAIWDAQINPRIYDIYMRLFKLQTRPEVNCKLFCAYSYVGKREERWGSWGHLENLDQLKDMENMRVIAPKYEALLDANTH